MTSLFIATLAIQPRNLIVDQVKVTQVYAGRRGTRVVEEFTARDQNGTITVKVYPFHTNVARTPAIVKKGDRISITLSDKATSVKVAVDQIKF
jgi:hypothetical protein